MQGWLNNLIYSAGTIFKFGAVPEQDQSTVMWITPGPRLAVDDSFSKNGNNAILGSRVLALFSFGPCSFFVANSACNKSAKGYYLAILKVRCRLRNEKKCQRVLPYYFFFPRFACNEVLKGTTLLSKLTQKWQQGAF